MQSDYPLNYMLHRGGVHFISTCILQHSTKIAQRGEGGLIMDYSLHLLRLTYVYIDPSEHVVTIRTLWLDGDDGGRDYSMYLYRIPCCLMVPFGTVLGLQLLISALCLPAAVGQGLAETRLQGTPSAHSLYCTQ